MKCSLCVLVLRGAQTVCCSSSRPFKTSFKDDRDLEILTILIFFKTMKRRRKKTVFAWKQKKLKQISVCDSVLFEPTKATENVLFCEWTIYIAQNSFAFVLLVGKGTSCAYWRDCIGWICASYKLWLFFFLRARRQLFFRWVFWLLWLDTLKAATTFKNVALRKLWKSKI